MSNGYQINEEDIDKVLNYLKIHDPELQIAINESILNQYYERSKT